MRGLIPPFHILSNSNPSSCHLVADANTILLHISGM